MSHRVATATFEVHSRLGVGGFGEVQLATMRKGTLEAMVALKRVRADLADVPQYALQFEREARISARLDHPHVVKLLDFGTDDVGPYLALEYVHGRPASSIIDEYVRRDAQVPLPVALSICRDAARGLVYAHQLDLGDTRGLIHRDISPDNVLVAYSGAAKLADFGIARGTDSTRMTTTGVTKGKLGFMAPELLDAKPPSVRSDLFAFAVTTYELLSGQQPFGGKTEVEIVGKLLKGTPARLGSLCQVPRNVEDWVMRALKKSASARPESAHEVLLALEAECEHRPEEGHADVRACMRELWPVQAGVALTELARRATVVKVGKPSTKKSGRPTTIDKIVGGGVLAGLVLGGVGYLLTRDTSHLREPQPTGESEQNQAPPWLSRAGPAPMDRIDISVESDPPGATVQLNGVKRDGKTPLVLERLRPGETYKLDVVMPGWFAWSDSFVANGQVVKVKLEKLPGKN